MPDPFKVLSTSQPITPMDDSMEMGQEGSIGLGARSMGSGSVSAEKPNSKMDMEAKGGNR